MVAVAVLASLALIGLIIYRAVKDKSIKAHFVSYGVAVVAGIFTYAYFLDLDGIPQLIKIVVSILFGIILIIVAALLQRRMASRS